MAYIPKTVAVYTCKGCGMCDFHDGEYCKNCGDSVRSDGWKERPATWWSVAEYAYGYSYGGPEEGGWEYESGTRNDMTVRNFDSLAEATAYANSLEEALEGEAELWREYKVKVYADCMAPKNYPETRPYYC